MNHSETRAAAGRSGMGIGQAFLLWMPPVLYAGAIFLASGVGDPPTAPGGLSDKHQHAMAYAGLAAVTVRAVAHGTWRGVTAGACLVAAILATAYGATDELHQRFVPGRSPDWLDLLADAFGAAAGAALVWAFARWRARAAPRP